MNIYTFTDKKATCKFTLNVRVHFSVQYSMQIHYQNSALWNN